MAANTDMMSRFDVVALVVTADEETEFHAVSNNSEIQFIYAYGG